MDVFTTKMDLEVEAADDQAPGGFQPFIRAYGNDKATGGDVEFSIHTFDKDANKWVSTMIKIPKQAALPWAAIVAGQCAL